MADTLVSWPTMKATRYVDMAGERMNLVVVMPLPELEEAAGMFESACRPVGTVRDTSKVACMVQQTLVAHGLETPHLTCLKALACLLALSETPQRLPAYCNRQWLHMGWRHTTLGQGVADT